ncbi:pneumococcal serine-rich repeat protein isoform X2 [Drosophila subobscura]|uniref:pneumococcal serine-rich repeat protein isoform X2 n=1 Tax=Drosophila subobscura TaxID=7241 RepID=UPI00155A8559|nr:pneumococcal serine-rich repeat protein isoform X2 [Drosophila subobscura]
MIPTSVTNSPPPASLAQNGAVASSLGSAAGVGGGGGGVTQSASSTAAAAAAAAATATAAQNNYSSIVLGLASLILEGRPIADDEYQPLAVAGTGAGAPPVSGGRLSPRPSTSRAAINITTNPYAGATTTTPRAPNGNGSAGGPSSMTTTHQRWTQKLCQLRQISPAAQSMSAEPELVSLAINDLNTDHGGDYEIVRRVMLNRAGGMGMGMGMGNVGGGLGVGMGGGTGTSNSSAASSLGSNSSDNILHSLQSLATTCLRGGPAMPIGQPSPSETRNLSLNFGWTAAAGAGAGAGCNNSNINTNTATATANSGASSSASTTTTTNNTNTRPKHGPHCDQFLRKMGLAKGEATTEAEEHICDMSYLNMTCNRWRAHCMKMEAILARRDPVCIEVYLGPVSHKLLLEQWIISGKEKVPPPTMTLPSLCSAIRSQLYFSQIVAWCDLLRKCDPSVYDSGRVVFASQSAGDLAGSGSGSGSQASRRPRLNIFYRIRQHNPAASNGCGSQYLDESSGFSAKASVHNFPNVNISESFSVSVCVRSLPRINGGLPHIEPPPPTLPQPLPTPPTRSLRPPTQPASTPTGGGGLHAASPTGLGARTAATTPTATLTTGSNCDNNGKQRQQPVVPPPSGDELDLSGEFGSVSHRERQLQKYRKRMQRRDKKREQKSTTERLQLEEPMEEGEEMTQSTSQSQSQSQSQAIVMTLTQPQPRRIAMISTGTQTSLSSCQQCGSEKTLLCLNCTAGEGGHRDENDDDTTASEIEDTSSCSLSSGDLIVGTPRNKAELLLQAIQRTPKNRSRKPHHSAAQHDLNRGQNNNQPKAVPAVSGCQVCKRQKTQHNFANGRGRSNGYTRMEQEPEQESDRETEREAQIERCKTPPPPAVADHIVVQFKTPISHLPLTPQSSNTSLGRPSPKPSQLRLNCSGLAADNGTPPPTCSPLMRKPLPKVNLTTIFCSSAPITIGCGSRGSAGCGSGQSSPAFSFDLAALSHAHSQLITPEAGSLTVQKSFSAPTLPNASLSVSPRFAKQAAAFYKRRSRHLSDRSDRSSLGSDEQLSDEDLESGMCSPAGSPLKSLARLATQFAGRPLLGNLEESLLQKRLMPKIEVMGFKLQLGASGGFCPTQLTIPAVSYFYELHGETLSTPYLCEIRLPRKGYSVPRTGTVQATLLNPMGTVVRMFVIPYDMRDMPPLHRTFIRQRILAEEPACSGQQTTHEKEQVQQQQPPIPRSPTGSSTSITTSKLGHFITAEQMKRLRYSIHLRFQTSRSGRLSLHTDIRLLISRRTDCDTAAAHAKGVLEAPNELVTDTLTPTEPRYSARQESAGKI